MRDIFVIQLVFRLAPGHEEVRVATPFVLRSGKAFES
jgi:hypothetical protein